jgi:hypothetical protein
MGGVPTTRISLDPLNAIALIFLSFFMQETHELAHTGVGRIVCGGWGTRDFNLWTLYPGCSDSTALSLLATWAGPAYSFAVMWAGVWLLARPSIRSKSVGFALIVSSMPLSRILTPLMGGGDEVFALNQIIENHALSWAIGLSLVLLLLVPPTFKVWQAIGNRRRGLWFAGLMLVPFLATGAVVFAILQGQVLGRGILDEEWILGSPKIVTYWFVFCIAVLLATGRRLPTLLAQGPADQRSGES